MKLMAVLFGRLVCAMLLVELLCLVHPVRAWVYSLEEPVFGPCGWDAFTTCPKPLACSGGRESTPPVEQYSPINLTLTKEDNELPRVPRLCIERVSPLVLRTAYNPDLSEDPTLLEKPPSALLLLLDSGGVLEGLCQSETPVLFNVVNCNATEVEEEEKEENVSWSSYGLMELIRVKMFDGALHSFDVPVVDGEQFEVEYHLKKINTSTILSRETNEKVVHVHYPVCAKYIEERMGPDLIISTIIRPSQLQSAINASLVADVLNYAEDYVESIFKGNAVEAVLRTDSPLLPVALSDEPSVAAPFIMYEGSEVDPPCFVGTRRVMLTETYSFPSFALEFISKITPMHIIGTSLVRERLPETKLLQGTYSQRVKKADEEEVDDKNQQLLQSIMCMLVAVDCLLLAVVLLQLFSGCGLVNILPPLLGGLNQKQEWYGTSFKVADALQYLMQHVNSPPEEHDPANEEIIHRIGEGLGFNFLPIKSVEPPKEPNLTPSDPSLES